MAELSSDWQCGDSDGKTKFNVDNEDGDNLFNAAAQGALGLWDFPLVFPGYGH